MKTVSAEYLNGISNSGARMDSQEEVSFSQVWVGEWGEYKFSQLFINKQYCEMSQKVTRLLENPLLPLKLAELLSAYLGLAANNQAVLIDILDKQVKELPTRFPTLREMDHKLWARDVLGSYMQEFNDLKPLADEIVDFVRGYFEVDSLKRF